MKSFTGTGIRFVFSGRISFCVKGLGSRAE